MNDPSTPITAYTSSIGRASNALRVFVGTSLSTEKPTTMNSNVPNSSARSKLNDPIGIARFDPI